MEGVFGYFVRFDDGRSIGHGACDARRSSRSNGIHRYPDTVQLKSEGKREPHHGRLGCRVIRLTEVAYQPGTRSRVDDAASAVKAVLVERAPMTGSSAAGQPWTSDVNSHDGVPGLCREVPDAPIAHDSGVVDQNVDATPFVERPFDHCLCVG